jgi:curved DNA-binding protein
MAKDLYETLGVSRTADADEIKKAYRKLAGTLHPDKNPGKKDIESRFKEVNHANGILSDPAKRAIYDEFGEDGLREGFDVERARAFKRYGGARRGASPGGSGGLPPDFFGDAGGGAGFGDLFSEIFTQQGGARPRARKGQDLESAVTIDFASAVKGTLLEIRPRGNNGGPVQVRVPPGAEEGSRIRIAGQGAPGALGGPPGDLLLVISVTPHPRFRREGDDLHVDLPVTVNEAFFGAKIRVPTPDGSVTMTLAAGAQGGQSIRLRGKGVAKKGKEPGDLYVHVQIKLPSDQAAADAVRALATFEKDDLRADLTF